MMKVFSLYNDATVLLPFLLNELWTWFHPTKRIMMYFSI